MSLHEMIVNPVEAHGRASENLKDVACHVLILLIIPLTLIP